MSMMVNMENYEEYMLLEADGELKEAEQKELYAFIALHPELQKEMDAYKATIFKPDETIFFQEKNELLKPVNKIIDFRSWITYAAAACVVALLFTIGLKWNNKADKQQTIIVSNNNGVSNNNITTKDSQELHSQPKDPIAIENNVTPKTASVSKKQVVEQTITKQSKIQVAQKETKTQVLPEPEKIQSPLPISNQLTQNQQENIVKSAEPILNHEEVIVPIPETIKEDKKLLAWLPVNEDKKQGLTDFGDVVNERIEKIKNIKNKLKNADVSFRIGKKELFVVKL